MRSNFMIFAGYYPCCECGRIYSHYTSRSRHMKYECGKLPTFMCSHTNCSYRAKRKGHLKVHMARRHNVVLLWIIWIPKIRQMVVHSLKECWFCGKKLFNTFVAFLLTNNEFWMNQIRECETIWATSFEIVRAIQKNTNLTKYLFSPNICFLRNFRNFFCWYGNMQSK